MAKPTSPFSFLNSINGQDKEDLFEMYPEDTKQYLPFMINRSLSYFQDTVHLANEMNANYQLDKRLQYDFLRKTIRPKRRFAKWVKQDKNEDAKILAEYYNISLSKATSMIDLVSKDDLKNMQNHLNKGGLTVKR